MSRQNSGQPNDEYPQLKDLVVLDLESDTLAVQPVEWGRVIELDVATEDNGEAFLRLTLGNARALRQILSDAIDVAMRQGAELN